MFVYWARLLVGLRGDEGDLTAPQGCASSVLHGGHPAPGGTGPSEAPSPTPLRLPAALPWVLGSQTLGAADGCFQQSPQWAHGECVQ